MESGYTAIPNLPTFVIGAAAAAESPHLSVEGQTSTVIWVDAGGGDALTGTLQVQGSIFGDEFVDVGAPLTTFPAYYRLPERFTHIRLVTGTEFAAGQTPRGVIYGFYGG